MFSIILQNCLNVYRESHENGTIEFIFMIGTTAICLDAWLQIIGLPVSSFYKIRQMVLSEYAFNLVNACGKHCLHTAVDTDQSLQQVIKRQGEVSSIFVFRYSKTEISSIFVFHFSILKK